MALWDGNILCMYNSFYVILDCQVTVIILAYIIIRTRKVKFREANFPIMRITKVKWFGQWNFKMRRSVRYISLTSDIAR